MTYQTPFPRLTDWEPTRRTLHFYTHAISAVTRAHAPTHPKWWHISLKVNSAGLTTDPVALPTGDRLRVQLDLVQHLAILYTDQSPVHQIDLTAGLTATAFGDQILTGARELGLRAEYNRSRFTDEDSRVYNPAAAGRFLVALTSAQRIFSDHRATLPGEPSPVQLWPHNFDLALDWYSSRIETYEHNGQLQSSPAQLNLGLYFGDPDTPPYFYSNPWPFEASQLLGQSLPDGAAWHTEGWQGTILPYAELAGAADAEARLRAYARTVYQLSAPTLME